MYIDQEQYETDSNYRKYIDDKVSANKWFTKKAKWVAEQRALKRKRYKQTMQAQNKKAIESLRQWKPSLKQSPLDIILSQISNKSQP